MAPKDNPGTGPDDTGDIARMIREGNDILAETKAEQARLAERLDAIEAKAGRDRLSVKGADLDRAAETKDDRDHCAAFAAWLKAPGDHNTKQRLAQIEEKAASGATDAAGGFLVPELISRPLLRRARDMNMLRPICRVIGVASGDVVLPLANSASTSGWVGETDTRTATTEDTLSGPKPSFGTLFANISATEELVGDAVFDVAGWFTLEAAEKLAEAEMAAIVSGNGTNKPTGFLHVAPEAGADGTRTAGALKYIPTGAASTLGSDPFDALMELVHDLKAGYRQNGRFVMNSSTAGQLRKAKDADGNYMWAPSLEAGQPDRLLGYPVVIAEAMPDIGADAHPIAFGDFSRGYVLADRGGLRVTLDDNITTPGQVRWYIRRRVGGIVYDEHAVRCLKVASS